MSATGFQLRRRELEAKAEKPEVKKVEAVAPVETKAEPIETAEAKQAETAKPAEQPRRGRPPKES